MDVEKGTEIDGFRILNVLGRGGMGIVYKAEDIALSRNVALKMIDPALARDESFLRRFRAEARALARIDSPYIVSVHALRQTDLGLFIVMEYVEGGTVADPISAGPMPWMSALPLIKQILLALDHAHSVGVIHRDIKPGNVMLTPAGVVKVTDFGLAKLHEQNVEATVTQGIAGTLSYMSPEQVKGQRDLDHRSDLYSLGMMIYEMLSGEMPLDTSQGEFAILRSIVEETPPPPSRFVRGLPDALVHIVMKALEKDPAGRFQSAREMLEEVETLESTAPVVVKHKSPNAVKPTRARVERSARRRRILFGGIATIVLMVAVGYLAFRSWNAAGPSTLFTVTTVPDGVTVYIGGKIVGDTPLRDLRIAEGSVDVALRKAGFRPADTTMVAESGEPLTLSLDLAADMSGTRTASGVITSIPTDAEVWINEEQVGQTPYTIDSAAPGPLAIVLRKDGFQDWEKEEEIEPGEIYTIAATLEPAEDRPSSRAGDASALSTNIGTLAVRAEPEGYIEVNGREVGTAEQLTLETGQHLVRCGEAPHDFEAHVTLAAGQTREVTCYFTSKINVVTTTADGSSTWASIWIDGQNQGLAPAELELAPGTYRISVQRDGFMALDEEKTLTLRPGFEPQTYPLSFRIMRE